jgi:hypothetical protein
LIHAGAGSLSGKIVHGIPPCGYSDNTNRETGPALLSG